MVLGLMLEEVEQQPILRRRIGVERRQHVGDGGLRAG